MSGAESFGAGGVAGAEFSGEDTELDWSKLPTIR